MPDVKKQKPLNDAGEQAEPGGDEQYVFAGGIVLRSTVESLVHMRGADRGGSNLKVHLEWFNRG